MYEDYPYTQPLPHREPARRRVRAGRQVSLRVVVVGAIAFIGFGALALYVGLRVVAYANRLEALERGAGVAAAPATPGQPLATGQGYPGVMPVSAAPQFVFMVGGQQGGGYGGVPVQGFYPQNYGMPGDTNQLLIQRYQEEFNQFLRQKLAPNGTIGGPVGYQDNIYALQGGQLYNNRIMIPQQVRSELYGRFSGDQEVELWLAQTTANASAGAGGQSGGMGGDGPSMDDILRRLAETTYADAQYDRTARIYAELAGRSVILSHAEMMRWSKAAELSGDIPGAVTILDLVLKNNPDDASVLQEAANLMMASDNFSRASEYYKRLMELQPNQRDWRLWRAKTLTWAQRGTEAVDMLRQLYAEDPTDWELNVLLAELLLSLAYYEESLPILDELIAHDPVDDSLKVRKLNALMALQRFDEAAEMCAYLLEKTPEDADLLLKYAINLVAAGKFADAIPPFEKYLELKPDDLVVREQFAEDLMASGEFALAADQFLILSEADPENIDLKIKRANALMAAQDFPHAAMAYADVINDRPDDPDVNMGFVVSLRMSGYPNEALVAAAEYLQRRPDDVKMLVQAAEVAVEVKKLGQAISLYRTALRLTPNDYKIRAALANTLLWNKHYGLAEAEFRRVLVNTPGDINVRRGYARSLYFQHKYDAVFAVYWEIMGEDPTGAIEAEYRYYCALQANMEDEAQKQLCVLQQVEPEDITWKGDRVQSLLRQHRFEEATQQAQSVYADDPSHRATLQGMSNANLYLTSTKVEAHAGSLRKDSKTTEDHEQDRKAKLTYNWYGLHAEKSFGYNYRFHADYDRERWRFRESGIRDTNSTRMLGGVKWEGHPTFTAEAEIGYRWITGNRIMYSERGNRRRMNDQWLYKLRGEMREVGGTPLKLGVFSQRREFWDNYHNAYRNLYAIDVGADWFYRWGKWETDGYVKAVSLSDSNTIIEGDAHARYRLIDTDKLLLMAGANVGYQDFEYERSTYWSPDGYTKYGLTLDGRYYWCRDPEVWGSPESYVDFGLSVYRDNEDNTGHKLWLGVNHDYGKRLSLFANLTWTKESYYKELGLFGGLSYKFGGCE